MNYFDFKGKKLSKLGFGCMRFPMKAGRTDMAETEKEILYAVENGCGICIFICSKNYSVLLRPSIIPSITA